MKKHTKVSFKNQHIYVGLDSHNKNWRVSIRYENIEHKTFTQNPEPKILVDYLHRNFPGAIYHCVYEAGYNGFWICDELNELGVDCIVVNPADIPTKDKDKRVKTDTRNARNLAIEFQAGHLTPIYIPSPSALADRQLVRTRKQVVKDRSRIKNQIKALLSFHNIKIPVEYQDRKWHSSFIAWLETIEIPFQQLRTSLDFHIKRLKFSHQTILELNRELYKLAKSDRYKENFLILKTIPGIGDLSAIIWLVEIVDINRFSSTDDFASMVRITPTEHTSDSKKYIGPITKRANTFLKSILVENAWVAIEKDPALMKYYKKLTKRMKASKAIIRVARKLLNRISHVLKTKEHYKLGIAR